MEYGLWQEGIMDDKITAIAVLILVLMEYGLWHKCHSSYGIDTIKS